MPATGKAYGLVDEADFFNPEKSAAAGLAYLKKQYRRFGNWWAALAAYNRGPGWVMSHPDPLEWPTKLKTYIEGVFGDRRGAAPRPLDRERLVDAHGRKVLRSRWDCSR
jgi:soluble lytic murein transglycosylase-like protein